MQIIPKTDNWLYVRLTEPFEKFALEQCEDDLVSLIRLHFGFPSDSQYLGFQKDDSDTSIYLKYDLGYYYLEDFPRYRRNGCLSHYTSKQFTGEKLTINNKEK